MKYNIVFSNKTKLLIFIFVELCIATAMYIFNKNIALLSDDYVYFYKWGTDVPCKDISDVLESQWTHYFTWGGRSIAHTLVQIFLMYDGQLFDILNTIMYIILLNVLYLHIRGFRSISNVSLLTILFVNLILFTLVPAFGESCFWLTGACNYLWCPTIALSFLLLYRAQYDHDENLVVNPVLLMLIFFGGVLAGWSNENVCLSLLSMEFIYIIINKKKNNKVYSWSVLGLLGTLTGSIFLLCAPGNFARMVATQVKYSIEPPSILYRLTFVVFDSFDRDFLLFPLIGTALGFFIGSVDKRRLFIYAVGLFVMTFSMVVSPQYPDRAKITSVFLACILVCQIANTIECKTKLVKGIIGCFLIMGTLSAFKIAYFSSRNFRDYDNRVKSIVIKEKRKGNLNVVVPGYSESNRFSCVRSGMLSKKSNYFKNVAYAKYYKLKSIKTE